MRDPFSADLNEVNDEEDLKEELIDLSADTGIAIKFSVHLLSCFWASELHMFSIVAMKAMKQILPFASTCQFESRLPSLVKVKSKYRNRMDVRQDIQLALFKIKHRISMLVKECCQEHKSH